ncbi:hypothetical protein HY493_03420 [Candidatus Woesearchaeota archaeon]|nr:hypothetical protein [Candidatus Woesearchaeota archaeon]
MRQFYSPVSLTLFNDREWLLKRFSVCQKELASTKVLLSAANEDLDENGAMHYVQLNAAKRDSAKMRRLLCSALKVFDAATLPPFTKSATAAHNARARKLMERIRSFLCEEKKP